MVKSVAMYTRSSGRIFTCFVYVLFFCFCSINWLQLLAMNFLLQGTGLFFFFFNVWVSLQHLVNTCASACLLGLAFFFSFFPFNIWFGYSLQNFIALGWRWGGGCLCVCVCWLGGGDLLSTCLYLVWAVIHCGESFVEEVSVLPDIL